MHELQRKFHIFIFMTILFVSSISDRVLFAQNARTSAGLSGPFNRSMLVSAEDTVRITKKPSKANALMLSLVLPGAGEWYAGSSKMARIFFGTEVALWATFGSFRVYGNWIRNDYQSFAAAHAGVDPSDKDHAYFVAVENYMNIQDYNQAKLQQRDLSAMYPENEEYSWQWDSDNSRASFEKMRVKSDKAFSRSMIVVGAIVVNHIISGIDAVRAANSKGKRTSPTVRVAVAGLPEGGAVVSVWKVF